MKSTKRIAFLGLLGAVAIVLSYLEGLLPPLPFLPPGAKAGFSNIVTMFSAWYLGLPTSLMLSVVKSLFVLTTRGVTAFCMSLAGGLFSTFVMWLCWKCRASFVITGIFGALTHNTAQLFTAILLTQTPYLFCYYPFLLIFAIIAGTVTGVMLHSLYPSLCRVGKQFNLFNKEDHG